MTKTHEYNANLPSSTTTLRYTALSETSSHPRCGLVVACTEFGVRCDASASWKLVGRRCNGDNAQRYSKQHKQYADARRDLVPGHLMPELWRLAQVAGERREQR
jgi:hypothetical protein